MTPIEMWFIAFILPAILGLILVINLPIAKPGSKIRNLIVHITLLSSIALSQYFIFLTGNSFKFSFSLMPIVLFTASLVISLILLGRFGFFYTISSLIQELCIVSIASLLLGQLALTDVILLVAPIYSVSHLLQPKKWELKIPLTFVWGVITITIFYFFQDPFLNIALHNIFGTILISETILYPETEFTISRNNILNNKK